LDSVPDELVGYPETILYDGNIRTVDDDHSVAAALAVRDGRFVRVGDTNDVRSLAGPETEEHDLEGRTVIPGLIDSHVHVRQIGMDLNRVTLFETRSIDDILESIAAEVDSLSDGEWVLAGWGWHETQLAEERLPTRWELDEVAPDNPVFIPRGGHVAVLNSRGLARAGIDEESEDPDGGTIVRDPKSGDPNGVVLENARTELVEPALPERGYEEYVDDIKRAMSELNSRGVTAALEPGLEQAELRAFQRVATNGEATVRTDALVRVYSIEDVRGASSYFYRDFGTGLLKIGGVKYMLDGGVEGARLSQPYRVVENVQEQEEYYGHYLLPPGGEAELFEIFHLAAERGHQVQTHVVGDEAIDLLLDAYESAGEIRDIEPLRWTAMHVQQARPDQIERMKELDVVATVQNHPTLLGRNMELLWGQERADHNTPVRTLLDKGLTVGGGTDAPVVPWYPFESIGWMVTRDSHTAGVLGPDEAITAREALELWTRGSAYTMHWEDEIGSIEPGKRADLAVLDRDIITCEPADIPDTEVELTMVGGDIVHEDERATSIA
jgi:predicted amidohydrolase YtcJ